jgi:glycine cleavage system H protein
MVKIDEYDFPDDLYYTSDHLWIRVEDDKFRVGLNDFGAKAAGKILIVRLKPTNSRIEAKKPFGTIESAKWVSGLTLPFTCTITEVNEALKKKPSLINEDPYNQGWMIVVKPEDVNAALKTLYHGESLIHWAVEDIKKRLKK